MKKMAPVYNREVSVLLAAAFGSKFRRLMGGEPEQMERCFQWLLEHMPPQFIGSRRLLAIRDGKVAGTLSLEWQPGFSSFGKSSSPGNTALFAAVWRTLPRREWRSMLGLLAGLGLMSYKPQAGEVYIADVAVAAGCRGQGIGKLLLAEAEKLAWSELCAGRLSLHVARSNTGARRLYEGLGFTAERIRTSCAERFLLGEPGWAYMVKKKGGPSVEEKMADDPGWYSHASCAGRGLYPLAEYVSYPGADC
jgi:ribosomal protein S18 acetylase RimI-like enzyme